VINKLERSEKRERPDSPGGDSEDASVLRHPLPKKPRLTKGV